MLAIDKFTPGMAAAFPRLLIQFKDFDGRGIPVPRAFSRAVAAVQWQYPWYGRAEDIVSGSGSAHASMAMRPESFRLQGSLDNKARSRCASLARGGPSLTATGYWWTPKSVRYFLFLSVCRFRGAKDVNGIRDGLDFSRKDFSGPPPMNLTEIKYVQPAALPRLTTIKGAFPPCSVSRVLTRVS